MLLDLIRHFRLPQKPIDSVLVLQYSLFFIMAKFTLFLALAAAVSAPTTAFAPQPARTSVNTALSYRNQREGGEDWDYDYGGSLQFGTGHYRQRYSSDRYTSGGVNSSFNGNSMQANNDHSPHRERAMRQRLNSPRRGDMMGMYGRDGPRGGDYFEDEFDDHLMDGGYGYEERMGGRGRMEGGRMMGGRGGMGGGMGSFHQRRQGMGGRSERFDDFEGGW